jgi:hypothetical protein
MRLVVQALGFVVGLLLLAWCVRTALSPDNREQLAKLGEASAAEVSLLLALSAGTMIINGMIFWAALEPVRRLPVTDVLATNALCTFLAFLPFKLGAVTRIAIHNRRDRVPLLTIGAWFGAMLVVMLVSYGPMAAASLWRRDVDALWWTVGLGGATALAALTVLLARPFAGERGLARLHGVLDRLNLPLVGRLSRDERFAQLHTVAAMLACPKAVALATALRLADMGVLAARFVVAGAIVGVGFAWEEAVLVASAYYLIGVVSPFGLLGAREAGAVWLGGVLGLAASTGQSAEEIARSLTVLTLFITGTESIVLLAGAAAGVAWLRPDRLLYRGGESGRASSNMKEREHEQ